MGNVGKMQGLTLATMKKHPALLPLFACIGFGLAISTGYVFRLATRNPDVSWSQGNKPEPWNDYKDKQYKFMSPNVDYSKLKSPAPEY